MECSVPAMIPLEIYGLISRALMDRVAGAGLSGAKEAPGFPPSSSGPPINPLLTGHYGDSASAEAKAWGIDKRVMFEIEFARFWS